MQVIEFHAVVEDGSIAIPPEYREALSGRVSVTVVAEPREHATATIIDQLLANPRRVPNFEPLTRDESHAR